MTTMDIAGMLPDPNRDNYELLKKEHPFHILTRYGQAISQKYPGKLDGIITESADVSGNRMINYAFYILASIGKGYSYRLLEVSPTTVDMYPLKVTLFGKHPQALPEVSSSQEFENLLNDIIRMGFTQTLLLNLVSQVELYQESRNQKPNRKDGGGA
jgi:hypothetical protein